MSALTKKVLRDMRAIRWRLLLIACIVGLGIAAYASGYMGHDALAYTRDHYFRTLRLADLELWTAAADPEELPDFSKLPEVQELVKRFFTPAYMEQKNGRPLSLGLIYMEPQSHYAVNDLAIIQGQGLSKEDPDGVVIERTFAEMHALRVGDRFTINPYHAPREVKVRGIAVSPEFLVPTANPNLFIPAKGSLGVVFLPMSILEETFAGPMYNDLCFKAAAGVSQEQLEKATLAALRGRLEVTRIIPGERQYSALYIEENLRGYIMFTPISVTVFALVTLLVTLLTIRRLVMAQETEIGTLMAMGFRPLRIIRAYLLLGVAIGIGGILVGTAVTMPLARLSALRYGDSMGLPGVLMSYEPRHLVVGSLMGFVATLLCVLVPLLPILRMQPHVAIRGSHVTPFTGAPLAIQPLLDGLALGSTARRFALRNVFRRPGLAAAIVVLIAAAVALSAAFRVSLSSWRSFAEDTFAREPWDALVSFRVPLKPDEVAPVLKTPGLGRTEPFVAGFGTLTDGDYRREIRIMGVLPPKGMRSFELIGGRALDRPDADEILLNGNFVRAHEYKVGSKVTIEVGKQVRTFTVVGLMDDVTVGLAYLPFDTARDLLGRGEKIDGLTAAMAPGADPEQLEKGLFSHEMVNYVSMKTKMAAVVREFMKLITSIVQISLGISYVLAMLFMAVGVSMTVMERVSEYATLRSLGFTGRLIWAIVYYEIACEGLAALAVSLPFTYVMAEYLRHKMANVWFLVPYHYDPAILAGIVIPACVFLLLAVIPLVRHVLKVPLATALRQRAFG